MVITINNKIKVISFLCTVMVLLRHSRNLTAFWGTEYVINFTSYIENFFSVFTEIAVPFFFLISGYFFFKYDYYKNNNYTIMIKKKIRTLLIPYVCWNIFGALILSFYDIDKIGNNTQTIISNFLLSHWNGPLWYIRNLILLMFLSPLYAWIFNINNKIIYSIVFLLLFIKWTPVSITLFSTEGIIFFFLGGIIRMNSSVLQYRLPFFSLIILFIIWYLYCFQIIPPYNIILHRLNTLIGIIVFWNLIDYIKDDYMEILYKLSFYSFFIYVMHTYIVKFIKKTIAHFFYENTIVATITYFLVPILTIAIVLLIAKYWKKRSLKTYLILTGGR